jgi:alpha-mannosidase
LFPHAGDLRDAGVIEGGYDLNVPLIAHPTIPGVGTAPSCLSLLSVGVPHVVIDTVKTAEGGSDALVVRMYEAWGRRGTATVQAPWDIARAERCDLLEGERIEIPADGSAVTVDVSPFEIVTLRLEPSISDRQGNFRSQPLAALPTS